jgi:hypothetical protein
MGWLHRFRKSSKRAPKHRRGEVKAVATSVPQDDIEQEKLVKAILERASTQATLLGRTNFALRLTLQERASCEDLNEIFRLVCKYAAGFNLKPVQPLGTSVIIFVVLPPGRR